MKGKDIVLIIASIALIILSALFIFVFPKMLASATESVPEQGGNEIPNETVYDPQETLTGPDGTIYVKKKGNEAILFMGVDQDSDGYESSHVGGQADTIVLVAVDHKNKSYAIVPINRDAMTLVNVINDEGEITDSIFEQVCLAHSYGNGGEVSCKNTADAVSYMLGGLEINKYAAVGLESISAINDAVGGVDVTINTDLTDADPKFVKGATVHLEGDMAESFIRARMNVGDENNANRMGRQKQYLEAFMAKAKSRMASDSTYAFKIYQKLKDLVITNISESKASGYLDNLYSYDFLGYYDILGSYRETDSFSEFYPDDDSVTSVIISLFYEKTNELQ